MMVTEKSFSQQVFDLARLNGWLGARFPTWRPTGTTAGYPDLTLVRGDMLIFAELKTEGGELTWAQHRWRQALEAVSRWSGWRVRYFVWRPSDWPEIERVLTRRDAYGLTAS